MSRKLTAAVLAVALCGVLVGIFTNVGTGNLPEWTKPYQWYAWPALLAVTVLMLGLVAWQVTLDRRSDQAKVVLPAEQLKRNRRQMIARVRHDWIEGVLDQSLYQVARIDFGLVDRPDVVDNPLTLVVQEAAKPPRQLPPRTRISAVFDAHAGGLLILGAPGSGKTTLLLELARELLDRAGVDETYPIPVVFNLSSWAVRRAPLAEWLVDELNVRYGVPRKLAQQWVTTEEILPLLDGLDEVAAEHREVCSEAINKFRSEHGLLPMAVCSRAGEYQTLTSRLRLPTAVVVQTLTRAEVESYLDRGGERLVAIRDALTGDETLWELLDTPLMLSIAMLAYQGVADPKVLVDGTIESRRRKLFARYVDSMFGRRASKRRYNLDHTTWWLSWLARTLARNNQTIVYLESLDVRWWPTRSQQWLAQIGLLLICGLSVGLMCGVILWLSTGLYSALYASLAEGLMGHGWGHGFIFWLIWGLTGDPNWLMRMLRRGLIFGLVFGYIGAVLKTQPVEKIVFRWTEVFSRRIAALRFGMSVGLCFCWFYGLSEGLSVGLMYGLAGGLIAALVRLFAVEAIQHTHSVGNEGTHRSIKMALIAGPVFGLTTGLILGSVAGVSDALKYGLSNGMSTGFSRLAAGTFYGLIVGFLSGGLFALKHFVLRLFVWIGGCAPLNYVAFLAQATEMLLLRQVGGGYIFVHRMLLEYFASLGPSTPLGAGEKAVGAGE